MSLMPVKTAVSAPYPNPDNDTARAGFGALWDALYEATEKPELDVASAATVNIGGQLSTKLRITGTTGITSFGTTYRGPILIRFAGILTLTHNATTLILPGAANITTSAGGTMIAYPKVTTSGTSDGWVVAFSSDYVASQLALKAAAGGTIALSQLSSAAANSGYPQSGTGGETLRIIRGSVSAAGAITNGSGFTVTKGATPVGGTTGYYTINFTTAFSGAPSVVTSAYAAGFTASVLGGGTTTASVTYISITNSSTTNVDQPFHFIAIGPA